MFINYGGTCFDDESGEVYEDDYNGFQNYEDFLNWYYNMEDNEADMYED